MEEGEGGEGVELMERWRIIERGIMGERKGQPEEGGRGKRSQRGGIREGQPEGGRIEGDHGRYEGGWRDGGANRRGRPNRGGGERGTLQGILVRETSGCGTMEGGEVDGEMGYWEIEGIAK